MNQLATAIVEPNLDRSLTKLETLNDAQTELANQLDVLNAAVASTQVDPVSTAEINDQIAGLKKRLTAVEEMLKVVKTRIDSAKERISIDTNGETSLT